MSAREGAKEMLRLAFADTLGDPTERRYLCTILSDDTPASLNITGADVIGMKSGDIIALGSQIISPTDNYIAFEDGLFKNKN